MTVEKTLKITPVKQAGPTCKLTAIAAIEKYWASQRLSNPTPIPLNKRKQAPISLRQISKLFGSVQGELLEVQQTVEILSFVGYKSRVVDCENNKELFKNTIKNNLEKKQPLISFFAVHEESGKPSTYGFSSRFEQYNEHAAVIMGYNEKKATVKILHWGKVYETPITTLFLSTMSLPAEREQEHYQKLDDNRVRKYKNVPAGTDESKASIIPQPNTGFRAKLIEVDAPPETKYEETSEDPGFWHWIVQVWDAVAATIYECLCCAFPCATSPTKCI